jgi:hypothetical protein
MRRIFPRQVLRLFQTCKLQNQHGGEKKRKHPMQRLIQLKRATPLFLVTLACFGLSPAAQAVVPAPDGAYPGGNTAEGQAALFSLTTGGFNTAAGFLSLRSNTTGEFNTATGAGTLLANTAAQNTATGAAALLSNTTGAGNTAIGAFALFRNTTSSLNTASGDGALFNNSTGAENTALGGSTLFNNTTGGNNTAIGFQALSSNTTGSVNTAIGAGALANNGGNNNTAVGQGAGDTLTDANNVICIGSPGANVSSTTWINNIYGTTTQSGTTAPVVVSDGGQLGTIASSQRFKKDIATMDKASEIILSLRPVTFRYKADAKETPQFGLIAEEVAKVNPALILPDKEGKPYTVRYDAVNAMLLNEFLKEHRKVEEQQATINRLQKGMETVVARLEEQESKIQKVSAQLAAASPSLGGLEAANSP